MHFNRMVRSCSIALLFAVSTMIFSSCGYTIGGAKPIKMRGISSLNIPTPDNRTQYPRLEAQLGNNLVDALLQDGTYSINTSSDSDAVLKTKITAVNYRQVRVSRTDGLLPEELSMTVNVAWSVTSYSDSGKKVLAKGTERGITRFFLEDNLQIARANAFPDALQRVSRQIISRIANTFE